MSNGDVRHSQAAHFFNVTKRNENNINIKVPSTATLVGATANINLKLSMTQNHNEKTSNYLAIKLNYLKDKEVTTA